MGDGGVQKRSLIAEDCQRVSPSSWFCLMRCRVCYDGAFIFIFASVMVSRVPYPVPESGYHFICPSALGTFWYAFVTTYAKALPEGRPWPVGRLRLGWNRRWWLIEISFGITRLIDGPCNTSPVSEFNQHHHFSSTTLTPLDVGLRLNWIAHFVDRPRNQAVSKESIFLSSSLM